jgi:hypothetical protein
MTGQPLTAALLLSFLSMLLFCGVAWVLTFRLLGLARRTRQVPEVALALSYLFIAGIGYPMCAASVGASGSLDPDLALTLLVVGTVIVRVGLAAMFVFTWKAFRPDSRWAMGGCALAALVLAVNGLQAVEVLYAAPSFKVAAQSIGSHPITVAVILTSAVAYGWPALESLRYYALLRRRLSLGLAEPLVVNRFLLWGVACSASVAANLINVAIASRGLSIMAHAPVLVVSSLSGVLSSVLLILAFLPPPSYVRLVEGRAAGSSSAG